MVTYMVMFRGGAGTAEGWRLIHATPSPPSTVIIVAASVKIPAIMVTRTVLSLLGRGEVAKSVATCAEGAEGGLLSVVGGGALTTGSVAIVLSGGPWGGCGLGRLGRPLPPPGRLVVSSLII